MENIKLTKERDDFHENQKIQAVVSILFIVLLIFIIILSNSKSKINNIIKEKLNNKKEERSSINTDENFQEEIENIIFNLINEERLKNNLGILTYNKDMEYYARKKAKDMLINNYYSNEDLEGKYIIDYLNNDGIIYTHVGENISYSKEVIYNSSNEVAEAFVSILMDQVDESDNISSPVFEELGVGVYKIEDTYYIAVEFYTK